MTRLGLVDGRIDARALPVAAVLRICQTMTRLAIVGVNDMARRASRLTIIAGLVIGTHEPGERIVEARLLKIEDGNGDAQARARPAIGLADVGLARLFQRLRIAFRIRIADLGELRADGDAAPFEHAEDVGRWRRLPARHGIKRRQRAARCLLVGDRARWSAGRHDFRGLAFCRVGLAHHIMSYKGGYRCCRTRRRRTLHPSPSANVPPPA